MKKVFVILMMAVALGVTLPSCQKEKQLLPNEPATTTESVTAPLPASDGDAISQKSGSKGTMTEYMVSPKFGKPSSTTYTFKVYDPSGALPLSVKLYERVSSTTTYKSMSRSGSYWVLSTTISINGWYDWRYVYSSSKANISSNAYILSNSKNMFNSCPYSLTWPFGADGSSYSNRCGWIDGNEDGVGNGGYGWLEGTHNAANNDQYAVDWNRGPGTSSDLGAELRSPLDGTVLDHGTYSTTYGASQFVSVQQEASDGTIHKFFFGHMQNIDPNIYNGKPVRAGVTKLGTLGMTGASSPHAHSSLRVKSTNSSEKFYFNAQ